jgi:arginyl-tRNA synthetase
MSEQSVDGTERSDGYRESTVEADHGRTVQVEEYPGGDMTIYRSDGGEMYFTSDQAAALRTAFGRIDGGKDGDRDE